VSSIPTITNEILRWSIPPNVSQWAISRKEGETWRDCHHRQPHVGGNGRKFFDIEELSLATLQEFWGPGIYRIVWAGSERKLKKGLSPFRVPVPGGDADKKAQAAVAPPAPAPPPPPSSPRRRSNGNGGGGASLPFMPAPVVGPTNVGSPPLAATDVARYFGARDQSPIELFMMMNHVTQQMLNDHREAEARRSAEFREMIDLRRTMIDRDAEVRIAESQARAEADRERASQLGEELRAAREQLLEVAQAANDEGVSPELQAVLDDLQTRLEAVDQGDDEDEPGAVGQVVMQVVSELVPLAKDALAAKLNKPQANFEVADAPIGSALGAAAEAAADAGGA
jgi:hypothetical protein